MSFAFQILRGPSRGDAPTLRVFAAAAALLALGIYAVAASHINMGWAGNAFLGP